MLQSLHIIKVRVTEGKMKVQNLAKYNKLSKSISSIVNVLFWIVLCLAVASILLTAGTRLFPNVINLSNSDGNFNISPDNIIRFEISTANMSQSGINDIYSLLFIGITVFLILILLVLIQLRKILKNVVNEKPFAQENAKRMKNIGYIVMAGSVLIPVIKTFTVNRIINAFDLNNVSAVYKVNTEVLLIGLLIILFSAIFSYGTYLQTEYDETI